MRNPHHSIQSSLLLCTLALIPLFGKFRLLTNQTAWHGATQKGEVIESKEQHDGWRWNSVIYWNDFDVLNIVFSYFFHALLSLCVLCFSEALASRCLTCPGQCLLVNQQALKLTHSLLRHGDMLERRSPNFAAEMWHVNARCIYKHLHVIHIGSIGPYTCIWLRWLKIIVVSVRHVPSSILPSNAPNWSLLQKAMNNILFFTILHDASVE